MEYTEMSVNDFVVDININFLNFTLYKMVYGYYSLAEIFSNVNKIYYYI